VTSTMPISGAVVGSRLLKTKMILLIIILLNPMRIVE
jgi:hypothetical protein